MSGKKGLERENKIVNLIHDFVGDELNHFGINVLVPKKIEKIKRQKGVIYFTRVLYDRYHLYGR
jgi:hypothetical protein